MWKGGGGGGAAAVARGQSRVDSSRGLIKKEGRMQYNTIQYNTNAL